MTTHKHTNHLEGRLICLGLLGLGQAATATMETMCDWHLIQRRDILWERQFHRMCMCDIARPEREKILKILLAAEQNCHRDVRCRQEDGRWNYHVIQHDMSFTSFINQLSQHLAVAFEVWRKGFKSFRCTINVLDSYDCNTLLGWGSCGICGFSSCLCALQFPPTVQRHTH